MSDISQIDGQAVRLQRETLGWATTDLATLACLSTKQIKQIEEGGISAFYSENVKLTAARKVAALLQMTEAQLFGQVAAPVLETPAPFAEDLSQPVAETAFTYAAPDKEAVVESHHASLSRSEALHFLAQPPEDIDAPHEPVAVELPAEPMPVAAVGVPTTETQAALPTSASAEQETGSSNYMFKIFALFLVALAVAALLRPKAVEEKTEAANQESAVPAPPPMQVPGATTDNQTNAAEAEPAANAPVPALASEKPATAVNGSVPAPVSDNTNPAAAGK